jgi:hypothetical protein
MSSKLPAFMQRICFSAFSNCRRGTLSTYASPSFYCTCFARTINASSNLAYIFSCSRTFFYKRNVISLRGLEKFALTVKYPLLRTPSKFTHFSINATNPANSCTELRRLSVPKSGTKLTCPFSELLNTMKSSRA